MVEPLFIQANLVTTTIGSSVLLTGDEAKHAIAVRRMRIGEAIQLSNGYGLRVRGTVSELNKTTLTVLVDSVEKESVPKLSFVLVQALAKGDRDELAIQTATELGIAAVIPWQSERSISRWDGPKQEKGRSRWQQIVLEATKQSLRAFVPEIRQVLDSTELAQVAGSFDLFLVLDASGAELSSLVLPTSGTVAIVVGPEGGISEAELERFSKAGAKVLSLGAGILRTSTAGPALLAALTLR
jgi:16S rRNA (uracil1498-N3)-methyltransferase